MASTTTQTPPISEERFVTIAKQACEATLAEATNYEHSSTEQWNGDIINAVLRALIEETKSADSEQTPWKFAVNSTIVQHSADPRPAGTNAAADRSKAGRRGMHSAAGAYWNNEKDGMWSYKYQGGEAKGMDVVVLAMYIST